MFISQTSFRPKCNYGENEEWTVSQESLTSLIWSQFLKVLQEYCEIINYFNTYLLLPLAVIVNLVLMLCGKPKLELSKLMQIIGTRRKLQALRFQQDVVDGRIADIADQTYDEPSDEPTECNRALIFNNENCEFCSRSFMLMIHC